MENAIGLFSRLGCRLRGFGDDARTREVIGRACRENGWFTPADICRAVAAVADGMLRRDALAEWLAPYPVPVAEPRRVLVVMAGNIPLVGFFDMLCVLAAGPGVPRKTIGQRYRPDGICHRVAARNRPAGSGGILRRQHIARCRDRYGQRQCQPLFPGAVCGHSRPAAR